MGGGGEEGGKVDNGMGYWAIFNITVCNRGKMR